ncbi:MAG: glycosyltransferase [Candidatus Omnitrophota bacterium]|jgi:cellulose synthase/poly-beta-1,6-N-acetylglucosamine synthase-like glycosyltransferase
MSGTIYAIFVFSVVYFLAVTVYFMFLTMIGSRENVKKTFEGAEEDYPLFYFSAVRMPVTMIVPVRNEEMWIEDSLMSLINLNYPQFEVIVVNDGSTDSTLAKLDAMLKLKPYDPVYIKHYKDGHVRRILTSEKYPNVTVIDKDSGFKKAGAANAGLNLAQYDYVCVVDADTVLERDSLLKVMAQVHKEPDKVIGVGSYFGLVNGFKIKDGAIIDRSASYKPIVAYQNIEYMRSFIGNRLAWSKYNIMPNIAGGFGVWRKDVLYELGGYSSDFTCEDLEFTFRAHDYAAKNREKGYKIIMLPYSVAWTEGPNNIKSLIIQRNRWQRVLNETIWKYKYMTFNPKYGLLGFMVIPYFVLYEFAGIFIEAFSLILLFSGLIAGVVDLKIFLAFFTLMLLTQAFMSLLCILIFVDAQRVFKIKYIMYLAGLSLVEYFWYRWIVSAAKFAGTFDSLRNKRSFDMYKRAERS